MMPWSELIVGWFGMGAMSVLIAYFLYSIRENAIRARRKEVEEEAVKEFRSELDDRGIALFEIPDGSADVDMGEERR